MSTRSLSGSNRFFWNTDIVSVCATGFRCWSRNIGRERELFGASSWFRNTGIAIRLWSSGSCKELYNFLFLECCVLGVYCPCARSVSLATVHDRISSFQSSDFTLSGVSAHACKQISWKFCGLRVEIYKNHFNLQKSATPQNILQFGDDFEHQPRYFTFHKFIPAAVAS